MNFNQLSLMKTAKITINEPEVLSTGSWVRHIEIKDSEGNEMDVTMFSDNRDGLDLYFTAGDHE